MRQLGILLGAVRAYVVRLWWTVRLALTSPDRLTSSLVLERGAAERDMCPRRCGLCRHFSREAFEQELVLQPAFREATLRLKPYQMGAKRDEREGPPPLPGSERARDLRPNLTHDWRDYGACTLYGPAIWGFAEQPPMPEKDSPPCGAWK